MKVLDVPQGSPEWFAARCGIVTASKFSDVLAKIKTGEAASRRNYRAKLVVERLTGKMLDTYQNEAMRVGVEREPLARAAYEVLTGNLVSTVGFCLDEENEIGCSPDGLVGDDGLIEVKCPQPATHLDYLFFDGEPPEYTAQIQGQMMITGRLWCDFVGYNPDFPEKLQLIVRRVKADPDYQANLLRELQQFNKELDRDYGNALRLMDKEI